VVRHAVRIGFVPSYRRESDAISPWCVRMRQDALRAFERVEAMNLVVPRPCPGDNSVLDPAKGYVPDGAVSNLNHAEAVADFFTREKVDGLIICALDFGDERSAAKVAERLRVPVLLCATKEPPARQDTSMARISDSYCGTLAIASALYRRKIPFQYAGVFLPEEPGFLAAVDCFVRAVAVVKALRGARVGQIGVRPESFETVGFDEAAVIQKFGQNVIYKELTDIVLSAKRLRSDDPRVLDTLKSIRGEVAEVTVADDWLLKAAKMELTLVDFWNDSKLSAMAIQCWPALQVEWRMSVCALLGRLTGQGMLTACEADTMGALAMLANYSAALGETPPHFVDWTIQHRENPRRFLAWHCGNAPVCLASNPKETALRSLFDMKGEQQPREDDNYSAVYQFQVKAGNVTFCRLAEYDNEWKMLIAEGEIVPSNEVLTGTWSWVEVADHERLYRTLVEEGFIHHASMIHGDQREPLVMACKFLDIKPIVVG